MNVTEKRAERLAAKVERLEGTNSVLKGRIADLKAKNAAKRSAKANAGASTRPVRTAPKRPRKSARGAQSGAAATA